MRPKLKGDTFYIPIPDGVYLRNNQGSFKIKGKGIYHWLERLFPYLDGRYTLEQITHELDVERQAMVKNIIDILLKHEFLKDTSQDLPHALSAIEMETYASEIAFIDSFRDSAAARFERFREHKVLLVGSGLTLTGLVHASLKCGLRQVAVIVTPECETSTRRHHEYIELFHEGDPRQSLLEINGPRWTDEVEAQATLQPFDTIIHVSDQSMLERASMLNRLCVTHKKNLVQAIVVDHHAWLGPLVRPGGRGCWECAWRRLQGNLANIQVQLPTYAFQDQIDAPISGFIALPTAAFIANLLVFEVLKYVTEAGPTETIDNLIEIDLETLQSYKHPFMPHPLCHTCHHPVPRTETQFRGIIQHLEQGEPLDQALFSKQAASGFEIRLGLFRSLDEEDFIQLPLSVCSAVVSNPMPSLHLEKLYTVAGFGTEFGIARQRAAQRACEIYAASIVDRRLLLSSQTEETYTLPSERFLSPVPFNEVKEWTWATELHTGRPCLVPAALAYPTLRGLSPISQAALGVSSGMSWAEAIGQALLQICQHLTITELPSTPQPYPQVNSAAMALEPTALQQLQALELLGGAVTVYDVTSPLQVPTFAICLQGRTVAYCSHVDVARALQDGFERALFYQQLCGEQLLVENMPAVPDLPMALRGATTSIPVYDEAPQEWQGRKVWLQNLLKRQGWYAFAVPLDHDPALSRVQPYAVHVLIARASIG